MLCVCVDISVPFVRSGPKHTSFAQMCVCGEYHTVMLINEKNSIPQFHILTRNLQNTDAFSSYSRLLGIG